MRYAEVAPGEWVKPEMTGYKMACCDCGLVHRLNFHVDEEGRVWLQAFRDNRATGQTRRWLNTVTGPSAITDVVQVLTELVQKA